MPARKKTRISSRAASTPSVDNPTELHLATDDGHQLAFKQDSWTDEQEIALFKGLIKWKPVGMHKHFRMIALSRYLSSHGFSEEHTRIPGIWKKLESLYNLNTLDEREDSLMETETEEGSSGPQRYWPFKLPDEFNELMFERRLEIKKSSSPAQESHENTSQGTVEDTEEPRSSPASVRGSRKGMRGRGGRGRGRSRLHEESTPRGKQRNTSAASPTEEDEDGDDDAQDDENGEDVDDGEESSDEEEDEPTEKETPSARGGRRGGRGRGGRGRGGARRGGRRR